MHRSTVRRVFAAAVGGLLLVCAAACGGQDAARPSASRTRAVPPVQRVVPGKRLHLTKAEIARRALARRVAAEKRRLAAIARANPLAQHPWGAYVGPIDKAWRPYTAASGTTRQLLGVIATRPKAIWFGSWTSDGDIRERVREYIAGAQHGDANKLVQMSVFRMEPWEHAICGRTPSARQAASYRHWVDEFAAGVGSTPAAIVLQPDGPFALCARGDGAERLIAYAAQKLGGLPNAAVYIDAGAGDWPAEGAQGGVGAATRFLLADGVKYVRGFALNSTHYSATSVEVARGAAIARALAAQGVPGKKFVVNTSSNGHPFAFGAYRGSDPDNARVCASLSSHDTCIALGIPPTTKVSDPRWGLSAATDALAEQYCDAYLWIGRPWLYRQADPFQTSRALALVRTWPY